MSGSESPAGKLPGRARRVRTPTVLQMEAVECGAAALSIILSHYGRFEPLEVLRVACGVSRDGSKASNIVKAARSYGLVAKGYKTELASLGEHAPPFIAFWNFTHFLVVEGWSRDRVYLNDPAGGPRTVTHEEFDAGYTGVVLSLKPGPELKKGGRRPGLLGALLPRLRGSRLALAYVILVHLGLVLPGLSVPTYSRVFIDNILVGGAHHWLLTLLSVMGITVLIRGALTYLLKQSLGRLETKLALSATSQFLWHLIKLPYEFFQQRLAGDLNARVLSNERVARLLSGDLAQSVLGCVMVCFYAALMSLYDARLCAITVALASINLLAIRWVNRSRVDENSRLLRDRGQLSGVAVGGLKTIETLKASGAEDGFFARWAGYQAKVLSAEQRLGVTTQFLNAVPGILSQLSNAAILGIGALRVMDGHLSMGQLIAFQALSISFLRPVTELVTLGGTIQEISGDLSRLDDVLKHQRDPVLEEPRRSAAAELLPVGRLRGRVELREVSFGYSRLEPPLIQGLNLTLLPGSRVALVGGSGSGKSTVAKLVAGLYQPWSGEILFDSRPRAQLPRGVLCNSLAVIDQDIVLFEGSARENITLWDATLTEAATVAAAKDAAIHDELVVRPGSYDARVEEGGRNFSGGQRQRIEIARALVRDPSILVIDEGTSALDPLTELHIDGNLRRRGCTCLIVAHRLSTIRDCDEILVLEGGRVVERGTHDSLIKSRGPYSRLVQAV